MLLCGLPDGNIAQIRWIMKHSRDIIAFTGGGSGGHVFPGFGVIDALEPAVLQRYSIHWIGSRGGIEKGLVEGRGLEFHGISTGKLRRYFSLRNVIDVFRFSWGILESFFLMIRLRPRLLFSKGGFVSVPPVIAAGFLGIPVVSHESDYDPGLATRINLRFTTLLCIPFEESHRFYQSSGLRVEVTGNPVRQDVLKGSAEAGRREAGFESEPGMPVLLVQGGSLGARQINELIAGNLPQLLNSMCIIHQTGDPDWNAAEGLPAELKTRYCARSFFAAEYPDILAAADIVLSRSGAGSLWEIGLTGKPAIFVPLTAGARGDQLRNAQFAARSAAAVVISAEDFAELPVLLTDLASDHLRRSAMAGAWKSIIHNRGAARIAELVGELLIADEPA